MIRALALLMVFLGGCATCREHPIACGIVGAVAISAIVIAADRHNTGPQITPRDWHIHE